MRFPIPITRSFGGRDPSRRTTASHTKTRSFGLGSDPIKILIVDDDEEALIALERLLEEEGYSTVTAWSGREALALSDRSNFDRLLVDEHGADVNFDSWLA